MRKISEDSKNTFHNGAADVSSAQYKFSLISLFIIAVAILALLLGFTVYAFLALEIWWLGVIFVIAFFGMGIIFASGGVFLYKEYKRALQRETSSERIDGEQE